MNRKDGEPSSLTVSQPIIDMAPKAVLKTRTLQTLSRLSVASAAREAFGVRSASAPLFSAEDFFSGSWAQIAVAFRFGLRLLFVLLLASPVFAHDPYEITSTINLRSNRTEVEIEMEFNAAMLLVGVPRSREPVDEVALFQSKVPELQRQAAEFLQLGSAGGALIVTGTNVTLGVENHVKFSLQFPAVRGGLRVNAAGLKSLGEQGPFGTTVTVLDLVNMKVLGQSVLFAESPVAEFASAVPVTNAVIARITNSVPVATQAVAQPLAETQKPQAKRESVWIFVVVGLFGVVLLVLVRRWRAAGGSQ